MAWDKQPSLSDGWTPEGAAQEDWESPVALEYAPYFVPLYFDPDALPTSANYFVGVQGFGGEFGNPSDWSKQASTTVAWS